MMRCEVLAGRRSSVTALGVARIELVEWRVEAPSPTVGRAKMQ